MTSDSEHKLGVLTNFTELTKTKNDCMKKYSQNILDFFQTKIKLIFFFLKQPWKQHGRTDYSNVKSTK